MTRTNLAAAAIAALAFAATAPSLAAADFGGDCCADLEERIAELEATTARKGNRKVSLTVSGHVNEAVMFWDDGDETNVYVVDNETSRTRFRFRGDAKINADWSAGYRLELGVRSNRSDRVNQDTDDAPGGVDLRYSAWYLESKTYGTLNVGQTAGATQDITEINVASNGGHKNADPEDYFSNFSLRPDGSAAGGAGRSSIAWRRLVKDNFVQPGDGNRFNTIAYESPTIAGFKASAAYGEDDTWDVALRYAGELGDFKVGAGLGYGRNSEAGGDTQIPCIINGNFGSAGDADCEQVGGSISAIHNPTGLYFAFGAGQFTDNLTDNSPLFAGTNADDTHTFYGVTAGIQQKWLPVGKTTFFGEYFDHDGGANDRTVAAGDALNASAGFAAANPSNIFASEVHVIGAGVVQKFDAAALELYAVWRRIDGDVTLLEQVTGNRATVDLDALDVVMTGARLKF